MELIICNRQFERLGIIETASVIWVSRYYDIGDFEIYVAMDAIKSEMLQKDNYVLRYDDEYVGIIEDTEITDDGETEYLKVTGRFAESLLTRRIVYNQTQINGTVENGLISLIKDNITEPLVSGRKIDVVGIKTAKGFRDKLNAQYTGDEIASVIMAVCKANGIGFKMPLKDMKFMFELYKGVDRSYAQYENPHVVFSDKNDNLVSSTYTEVNSSYKNFALVAGEGEGSQRRKMPVGTITGIDRRETFVDARDISSNNGEVSNVEYDKALTERGYEKLGETSITQAFDGEVSMNVNYEYKKDYFLGDITTIMNDRWNMSINTRIIEVMESEDENGYIVTPTFGA
ncbi:siphovirus ReqiPepy6 Gp37-like family protein [[Clostridium] innocuum]|nr:siphovirus ReqiPepy6 Gp37-like family protein [[Clostridium] innocuum]